MADPVDQANDLQEQHLASAIAAARGELRTGNSADECVECGDQISSERQLAVPGCLLCVSCAEIYETKRGRYRG